MLSLELVIKQWQQLKFIICWLLQRLSRFDHQLPMQAAIGGRINHHIGHLSLHGRVLCRLGWPHSALSNTLLFLFASLELLAEAVDDEVQGATPRLAEFDLLDIDIQQPHLARDKLNYGKAACLHRM